MAQLAGTDVPIVWQGRRALAFVPATLVERDLTLSPKTVERTATAVADVSHSAADMPADYEPLARLLLRSEGVASSYIEGVTAPIVDVLLAEELSSRRHTAASWVAANLAAVTDAVASAHAAQLATASLCDWHRMLMTGSPTPARYVGAVRTEQGWIGGTSPLDAALVTPPPDYVPELLADLVAYANREDVDPIAQAAICHAQFEIIHPFGDGNGRVGRVLISWVLTRRLQLMTPPPVSSRIAADVGGYLAGLALFRIGDHEPWVRWFAETVSGAGRAQRALVRHVEELQQRWRIQLSAPHHGRTLRSDSSAWRLLDLLPGHLVLTSGIVARETGQSARAANGALGALVDAGVLVEHGFTEPQGKGRPSRLYVSEDLLALSGSNPLR